MPEIYVDPCWERLRACEDFFRQGVRLRIPAKASQGQTRGRVYTEERPKVTFADVASNEEAKEDLQETVDKSEVDAVVAEAERSPASSSTS